MKTDSIFHRIFQTEPGIFFELLGKSPNLAQNYDFSSVEIKQVAFRLDGVFLPKSDANDQTVWFVEVQFQKDPVFYQRFFSEIYLYLGLYPETVDWRAVVIFPTPSIESKNQHAYRANLNSDQVQRIYLNDLRNISTESISLNLMQLILANSGDAITQAQELLAKTRTQTQTDSKIAAIIELIETIIVYKFPQLSREEIERMLGLSELKQTKVYQEALQEGEHTGEARLVLRQLARRIGTVPGNIETQVQTLSLPQIESLGEALLDFSNLNDLKRWLSSDKLY